MWVTQDVVRNPRRNMETAFDAVEVDKRLSDPRFTKGTDIVFANSTNLRMALGMQHLVRWLVWPSDVDVDPFLMN